MSQVETFMDNVATTPEGRHHLRQASGMQRYRIEAKDFENSIQERREQTAVWREEYAKRVAYGNVGDMKAPPTKEQEEAN